MAVQVSELADLLFQAADDEKADDIVLLDVADLTIICDYFLICTGKSLTHVKAIADGILENMEERGVVPLNVHAPRDARWIAMDYGGVVVHVFTAEARAFYDLERLWHKATVARREVESAPQEAS